MPLTQTSFRIPRAFKHRSPRSSTVPGLAFYSWCARLMIVCSLGAAALAAVAAEPTDACPPELTAALIRQFGYDEDTPHLDACKRMPGEPHRAIVALSFLQTPPADLTADSDMGDYDLDVAIVEADSAQVRQRLKRSAVYVSDALRLSALEIDTAPYVLAPGQRAFGVRARFSGSSRINPFGQTKLALYLPGASKPRLILDDLTMAEEVGEWDGECAGQFTKLQRVLFIGSTSTRGSADLIVRSTRTEEVHKLVRGRANADDDCAMQTPPAKTTRQVLRFDGKRYDTRVLGSD